MQIQHLRAYFRVYFLVLIVSGISACSSQSQTAQKIQKDREKAPDFQGSLIFKDVSLEQADPQGNPLWKIKAKQAIYSKDKKVARIQNPKGNLFQDGKIVLQISGDSGEVENAGKNIFLKGHVVAIDPRNGIILKGKELQWVPKDDLLLVRNNLIANNQKMQISAREGRYFSRLQQIELFGQIVGISKDPSAQMKTQHLIWQVQKEMLIGDKYMTIVQYKDKKPTGQGAANWSEINLKTKIANLKQNVNIKSVDPPIEIKGSSANWNLNTKVIVSQQPMQMQHFIEQVTLTANRSQVDLEKKIAYLTGAVEGVGTRNQSKLNSNQLTWYISTQEFVANGNVFYRQANPPLSLTGPKAVGKIQGQNILITGDAGSRVITNIIP